MTSREREPMVITVEMAAEVLGALYSGDDLIKFRGEETSPSQLACGPHAESDARTLRISYWTSERLVKNGTLTGMIRDRLWGAL